MTCLIVEDDPDFRMVLAETAEAHGLRVVQAADVDGALSLLRTVKPRIVLLDYFLKGNTSEAVADYVNVTCPNSRIILLTGSGIHPNGETQTVLRSVDWVLRKPVSLDDLGAMIAYATRDSERYSVTPEWPRQAGARGWSA